MLKRTEVFPHSYVVHNAAGEPAVSVTRVGFVGQSVEVTICAQPGGIGLGFNELLRLSNGIRAVAAEMRRPEDTDRPGDPAEMMQAATMLGDLIANLDIAILDNLENATVAMRTLLGEHVPALLNDSPAAGCVSCGSWLADVVTDPTSDLPFGESHCWLCIDDWPDGTVPPYRVIAGRDRQAATA